MRDSIVYFVFISMIVISGCHGQHNASLAPEVTPEEADTLSFRYVTVLPETFIDIRPPKRDDGIPVGELGTDGGDSTLILKLANGALSDKDSIFDSFLIAHKDKLLFESYSKRGRINHPHPQASTTKAYTSLLLGRAIQLGYFEMSDLGLPLTHFLQELDSTKFVEGIEKITLHKALTMTGGLRITDELDSLPVDMLQGQGAVQARFERSAPITAESQDFSYGKYNPYLVMHVIDAVVPGTASDFIHDELFGKLGITDYRWRTADSGIPEAGWGVSITSRDMVKIGMLVMNKGVWNGEQLIPESYINKTLSRIIEMDDDDIYGGGKDVSDEGYGYLWWNADLHHDDQRYYCASAQGGGGQYIMIIEDLDLIIVATGHNNRGNGVLQIAAEWIIPAFVD